ncbi:hypothetical protein ACOBQX_23045 [Actinokineospora sp. G85]|uniref:hypothetical protein n=1 Tax=Actinokineospora sp. G85 TaxID=3406626 RepID=UPI003C74222A
MRDTQSWRLGHCVPVLPCATPTPPEGPTPVPGPAAVAATSTLPNSAVCAGPTTPFPGFSGSAAAIRSGVQYNSKALPGSECSAAAAGVSSPPPDTACCASWTPLDPPSSACAADPATAVPATTTAATRTNLTASDLRSMPHSVLTEDGL